MDTPNTPDPAIYEERLNRYRTAMANGRPDRIPIRPFAAEFTANVAGMTCQEITQDYEKAFEAVRLTAREFDWDAMGPTMVYIWGGIPQMLGTRYYAIPGVGLPPDVGFQYLEPPGDEAWMPPEDYPALIADPTAYLIDSWLPRTQSRVVAPGEPVTRENQMAWLKGGIAMSQYFNALGSAVERLRVECAMPSSICGILKSPFDIIADKFRGYVGLTMDLFERPDEVMAAAEAMMPHMLSVAMASSDPTGTLPLSIWMHRGCVPFITPEQFDRYYWPTLKPIIEELWAAGRRTIFYMEGKWEHHWDAFLELPEGSIIVHCDRDDVFAAQKKLGHRFAISGGIPNVLLSYGKPDQVRAFCRRVIDEVAVDGGYIADAGAILQNDASIENMRVMTETFREYGVYSQSTPRPDAPAFSLKTSDPRRAPHPERPTGTVEPWDDIKPTFPSIVGDEALVKTTWNAYDAWANTFLWHMVVSF
ncbi:uroporphyrinogen decarboxylase family protein [Kiritimatiella glycovorans]|uniref:Uroporphyrinogen-III decarboxylase n=1 Tax=Kiritimatiella glycovorans TaxID=1307763 RepID=A0A0G3EJT3_9BACT|nr:uroporphyrinogen decarboxylase family protein [Kiritimatiella glycovorans]AKJ64384.1 Uroporphyrinogen-III decarboxylase [Kiritimatiella glycovorans]